MACGVPCLSTNIAPIKRAIGNTGWVIENKSSKELAKKLIFIIKNKSILQEKSASAREIIIKQYSQDKMLKEYYLTYKFYL